MLPALTASRRRVDPRRAGLLATSAVLAIAAIGAQVTMAPAPKAPAALADELRESSWAIEIPAAWLAARAPSVRRGDALDILAVRSGDRAYAVPVAYAVIVMSADDRALVLQIDQDDAIAIANARGAGLMLIPLLRSTR
ncbi:MAG TPA: hypothetical protein VFV20_07595 [Candidatus Limnocylindria bacterium]|nr:hypothetical protein [Candidatus Limnocylindria bacterium]